MSLEQEKRNIVQMLRGLGEQAYMRGLAKEQAAIQSLVEEIAKDEYTVVVLGEFKRGKSTFINALLGQSLLPMDVLPETATINFVKYSESPSVTVFYQDGRQEQGEASYNYLKRFSGEAGMELAATVRYLEIGYPLDILKHHIVIVDTPGVDDLNEQRSAVTYGITPRANAVLFLLDAASPLKETERQFIEDKLIHVGVDNIIFIANRYDFVDEEEEPDFLDDLKVRIENAFTVDGKASIHSFEVLPLSASTALRGRESGDDTLVESSGLPAVQEKIQVLFQEGRVEQEKVAAYQRRANQLLHRVEAALSEQIALKEADVSELASVQGKLDRLMKDAVQNKQNILAYIEETKRTIYAMTDKSIGYFEKQLTENVEERVMEYQGDAFKAFVETRLTRMVKNQYEAWLARYSPQIEQLLQKLEAELSKGISRFFQRTIHVKAARGNALVSAEYQLDVEATDITDVKYKAGIIAAISSIGLLISVGSALLPIISLVGVGLLRDKMTKASLDNAKKDILPKLEAMLAKNTLAMQDEVHRYIDERCEKIRQNTEMAYDYVLKEKKMQVEQEIQARQAKKKTVELLVSDLAHGQQEVRQLMAKLNN